MIDLLFMIGIILLAAGYLIKKNPKLKRIEKIKLEEIKNYGSCIPIGKKKKIESSEEFKKDYQDYMLSSDFNKKKLQRFALDNGICQRCKHKVHISKSNCHHIRYINFKNEPMEDLRTLCIPCHEKVHEFHGKNALEYPINF